MAAPSGSSLGPPFAALLSDILADSAHLDPHRGERGPVHGKRTSTPLSRRAPADLDVLVLTDPRTGVLAVLTFWAGRIRRELRLPRQQQRTATTESEVLSTYWLWACSQPWGPAMVAEMAALASRLHEHRYGVAVRPCPVCGEPVRLDRFVTEHRACLDTAL